VFISWSGDLSKTLADAIQRWLPSALQFVKPYFTPDVDKGARWANEISKELADSAFGIIVLTPENFRSPWINFEAGAISRMLDQAKVCPIVFGMEPTDVEWPLAQFQATRFVKEDIHRLFKTINAAAGDRKLAESVADGVFVKWWPDLESEVKAILESAAQARAPAKVRSERQLVEEILSLVRSMSARQEQIEVSNQNRDLISALRGTGNLLRPNALTDPSGTGPYGPTGMGPAGALYGGIFSETPLVLRTLGGVNATPGAGTAPDETSSQPTDLATEIAGPTGAKRDKP
jgi:hypothetical protein